MSRSTQTEMTDKTRAWVRGRNDAEQGKPRQAPFSRSELVEAYGAGYDSVDKDES